MNNLVILGTVVVNLDNVISVNPDASQDDEGDWAAEWKIISLRGDLTIKHGSFESEDDALLHSIKETERIAGKKFTDQQ